MKTQLLKSISSLLFLAFATSTSVAQEQKGSDWPLIESAHVAVILVDYPDTPDSIKSHFPSPELVDSTLFDPTSVVQRYFDAMSYGKFTLTGKVFGFFTHQDSINEENDYQQNFIETITTVEIEGFDPSAYDFTYWVSFNDYGSIPGGLAGVFSYTVNNVRYTDVPAVSMGTHIGYPQRDEQYSFYNIFETNIIFTVFVEQENPESNEGEISFDSYTEMTRFERTAMHEFIHALEVGTHANSRTNGERYEFEPEVANNENYLNREYGNLLCIMGKSEYATSLNGGYRDLLGWTDDNNRIKVDTMGKQTIRLYPINRNSGYRIGEVRIPYEYSEVQPEDADYEMSGYKNHGYFLEVREVDEWDSTLVHPEVNSFTEGITLMKTVGYTTWLLDATPTPNFTYNWGNYPDFRDLTLKPGEIYDDNSHVRFDNVVAHDDGSFSVDVEIHDITTGIADETNSNIPETFKLEGNYPNPFNPTTTISYDLPEQAQVTLSIYDLLGKKIKPLVNQSQDAGNKIAMWDGTDDLGRPVSAGVYLYRIKAGEFSQTRKMLLLK